MLKKSLILAAVLAAAVSSYGQGLVVFDTTATGARVTDAAGVNLAGTAYWAQLYGSATETGELTAIGAPVPFRGGNNAGYARPTDANTRTITVPTATPGGPSYLVLKAWDAKFASYDEAVAGAGAYGESARWTQITANPDAIPPAPPSVLGGLTTFALVPEPSVLALIGVGAAALLFRRRK